MAKLVPLRDLRKQIKVTRTVHPRLDVLMTSVENLGVLVHDENGTPCVTEEAARILADNYCRVGIFGRKDTFPEQLAVQS
jgi:hypothetical protein